MEYLTNTKTVNGQTKRNCLLRNGFGDSRASTRKVPKALASALLVILLSASIRMAVAQDPNGEPLQSNPGAGGPPPNTYQPLQAEQLDQLVAPISLYPDALVAQILAASTFPDQVAAAEHLVDENVGAPSQQLGQMADSQPWDPGVKALVAFPQVLHDLNRNIAWTTQLGNAYYNQPQDLLRAVQEMRQRAYLAGTLRPSTQLAVTYAPGNIVIAPVNPEVVYVPYYNPGVIFGAPLPVFANYSWAPPAGVSFGVGGGIGFGAGISLGGFVGFGWGFHAWAPNWQGGAIVFNHNTYISSSTTVFNHGHFGGPGFNPGGPMIPNNPRTNPGGPMIPNGPRTNPGGPMIPNGPHTNPGGPMIPNALHTNAGGQMNHGPQSFNSRADKVQPHTHGMSQPHRNASRHNAPHADAPHSQ
jgi:hypothetical protein